MADTRSYGGKILASSQLYSTIPADCQISLALRGATAASARPSMGGRPPARRWVLLRGVAVARGYHRRLPPLILVLKWDRLARFVMRACLVAAVAAWALAGASDHTQGTRPRPR